MVVCRIESIQGAWYNWLSSTATEKANASIAIVRVETRGRISPKPRNAANAQRVSPA